MSTKSVTQVFDPGDARELAARAAEHVPEWDITPSVRDDGTVRLLGYVRGELVWAACELVEPVGGYRWQLFRVMDGDLPEVLVFDDTAACLWLARELQHELLATKVVGAVAL